MFSGNLYVPVHYDSMLSPFADLVPGNAVRLGISTSRQPAMQPDNIKILAGPDATDTQHGSMDGCDKDSPVLDGVTGCLQQGR
jgi:hypothetical protein